MNSCKSFSEVDCCGSLLLFVAEKWNPTYRECSSVLALNVFVGKLKRCSCPLSLLSCPKYSVNTVYIAEKESYLQIK